MERDGQIMSRWTNGEAVLPLPEMSGHVMLEIHLAGSMIYAVDAATEDGASNELLPDVRRETEDRGPCPPSPAGKRRWVVLSARNTACAASRHRQHRTVLAARLSACRPHPACPRAADVRRHRGGSRCDPRRLRAARRVLGRGRAAPAVPRHHRQRAGAGVRPDHRRLEAAPAGEADAEAAAVTAGPLTRGLVPKLAQSWQRRSLFAGSAANQ